MDCPGRTHERQESPHRAFVEHRAWILDAAAAEHGEDGYIFPSRQGKPLSNGGFAGLNRRHRKRALGPLRETLVDDRVPWAVVSTVFVFSGTETDTVNRTIATLALATAAFTSTTAHGQDAETYRPTVPLMLPASDSFLQSFVRLINKSDQAGDVCITAVDDGGNVYDTVTVQLAALQTLHFNSGDLTNGNANKGIDDGIGAPMQGNWRLTIGTNLDVEALSYTRARDGFLTATHELLPGGDDGYLVRIFNPASNETQQSRLRLINWGAEDETVRIDGVDDGGNSAGPVSLTLPAGHSRTLTAIDLEQGATGLQGMLGDGRGKWQLNVRGNTRSIAAQSLLYASSGHVSNLSAAGLPASRDDHGNGLGDATTMDIDGHQTGRIEEAGDIDWFRVNVAESGTLTVTVYITGGAGALGRLYDSMGSQLAAERGEGSNLEIVFHVDEGTYFVSVEAFDDSATGSYTLQIDFDEGIGDDHGNSRRDATMIALGSEQLGEIEGFWDEDWFRINITETGILTVLRNGSLAAVFLYDDAGSQLATNDYNRCHRVTLNVEAGTYYVRVYGRTGSYTLHTELWPVEDDHGNDLGNATTLALGSYQFGRIEEAGDRDVFGVNVTEPGNLTVYTEGSLDTVGWLVNNANALIESDDSGINFRIERRLDAGSYFVFVLGDNGCTGDYAVRNEFTPN